MSPWLKIAVVIASLVAICVSMWPAETFTYVLVVVPAGFAGGWIMGGALQEMKERRANARPHRES